MRYEIAKTGDLKSNKMNSGLESKKFSQTNSGFKSKQSKPAGVCWKSENRLDILKDDDDVIN